MSAGIGAQVRATLAELLHRPGFDARVDHAAIEVRGVRPDVCTLAGSVLDEHTLRTISSAIEARFPALAIDAAAVQVLRRPPHAYATISTNVADVHVQPSFAAEMSCQVLANAEVEVLLEPSGCGWSFVRQSDGYLGWIHRGHLRSGRAAPPTHVVATPVALLREQPSPCAPIAGRLFAATALRCDAEEPGWLRAGELGWVSGDAVVCVDQIPGDAGRRRAIMARMARELIGIPYRWGGDTPLGLDCSGFVRLLHRVIGVTIPRDADMQHAIGRPVDAPFALGDLLYFGGELGHRSISHVGLSLGDGLLIHASRPRGGIQIDSIETTPWLRDRFAGARSFL